MLTAGCLDFGDPPRDSAPQSAHAASANSRAAPPVSPPKSPAAGNAVENMLAAEEDRLGQDAVPESIFREPEGKPFPLEAETDEEALAVGGRLELRRRRIAELARHPDRRALDSLKRILANRTDPLSAMAAIAISQIGGPEAQSALENALADPRVHVRQMAVSGLVDMRALSAAEHCRTMLQADRNPGVRAAAAVGLGLLMDTPSKSLLRERMREDAPIVRFGAAWSLAHMRDEHGFLYLQRLAVSEDPQASPQAIHTLGALKRREAVPALYRCLYSHKEAIWQAALQALSLVPEQEIEAGLSDLGERERTTAELHRRMLMALSGKGEMPLECHVLAVRGTSRERVLALRCLSVRGGVNAVPVVIEAMEARESETRIAAAQALQPLIRRHGLTLPEDGAEDWRRWWFGQYRVLAATSNEALLMTPAGTRRTVRVGTRLDWGAPVVSLRAGSGEKQRAGAAVTVQTGTQQVQIRPVSPQ